VAGSVGECIDVVPGEGLEGSIEGVPVLQTAGDTRVRALPPAGCASCTTISWRESGRAAGG